MSEQKRDSLQEDGIAKDITVRDFLILVNKDIAEGQDEDIWHMSIEEYIKIKGE